MDRDETVRPQQKVCETKVDVPTILVEPFREGDKPEVFVQWFGESSAGVNLGEMQFRFPLGTSTDSHYWMGRPELCKIIMLGKVKDWPKPEVAQEIADTVTQGNLDALIVFIVATHYTMRRGDGSPGAPCFVFELKILLADGVCGVITPQPYCDMLVLDRENEHIASQLPTYIELPSDPGENYGDGHEGEWDE